MTRKRRRGRGEGGCFFSESKNAWLGRVIVGTKPNGKPHYAEVTARSKSEVLEKMRKKEAEAREGIPLDLRGVTTGEFLQHWLDRVARPTVRETTWARYEQVVRLHLKSQLGGIRLQELRPQHVERYFADRLEEGMSRGNAKKVSEVLASALEHAVATGLIRANPSSSIAKPQPEEEEILPFSPVEVKRILAAAAGHRLEALFPLAFATGACQGELLGLGWDHIDFAKQTMRVDRSLAVVKGGGILKEPKSRRGRRLVELPAFAVDALEAHRERMEAEGNLGAKTVFCTSTGGFVTRSFLVNAVWHPLLKRAGVPARKFHTARHTHISELLSRGESVVDVARRVGDRPDVILKTYAHFVPGNKGNITSRLDEMYG